MRLSFDNPGEELKPNMYANVKIFGGPKDNVVVIPLEGLIRTGRNDRVIINLGEGRFEAREVVAGIESGDYVEILQGVNEGDQIVVSGQFLIDSEASIRASMTKMSKPAQSSDNTTQMKAKKISAEGVIKQIKSNEHKINLSHEAIEALGWPSMTMDFAVANDVLLDGLNVDETVMFNLEERNESYIITSISKMPAMENQP